MQPPPDRAVTFGDGIAQAVDSRCGRAAVVAAAQHILRFLQPVKPFFDRVGVVSTGGEFSQVAHLFGDDAQAVQRFRFELVQLA